MRSRPESDVLAWRLIFAQTYRAQALFLSLWGIYACIGPGFSVTNANSLSRIGLVLSIIEYRSLTIDEVADSTVDRAEIGAQFGASGFGAATPALGWATVFFGHDESGACPWRVAWCHSCGAAAIPRRR